jgi:hypothetical protein
VKAAFIIINKDAGRNMHGIYQAQALFDPAFQKRFPNTGGNIDKLPPDRDVDLYHFTVTFHIGAHIL